MNIPIVTAKTSKRRLKHIACYYTYRLIDQWLLSGGYDGSDVGEDEASSLRLEEAMSELADEMYRRSGPVKT